MRFGRKILAAIKEGAAPRLDPALWDFFSDTKRISGDHQLLPWLHYEYARSYRPVVEAVQRIRNHPADPEPTFAFAKMLAKRFPEFPDIPTCLEKGYNVERSALHFLAAKKGTPQPVLDILRNIVKKAADDPQHREALIRIKYAPQYLSSEEMQKKIDEEFQICREIYKVLVWL